jgi:transcriptional regulator with PAS, ATPase and Fis domain
MINMAMDFIDKPISKIKPKAQKLEPQIWTAMKRDYVLKALMQCDGSTVKAAKLLGISRQQVWYYKRDLGI